ncbi:Pentatricopeptide repeat-containing protein [Quillaja saponaria]|uniref:Pentatricopeptide repeat-containing protein n=1 Tax=Quillaja saponaria TaxID=32244 RepID=A0AAD7LW10_QUISA|nr:Pentatricopeptide repeat-containing protein [Quillaja saponaria]
MIPAISIVTNITVPTNKTVTPAPKTHKYKQPPNQTLTSLCKSGKLDEALRLIESPPSKSTVNEQDFQVYSLFLHACISRKSLEHGQRLYLHFLLFKDRGNHNFLHNPTLKSKFITLYSICGRLDEARRVFDDGLNNENVPEAVWVAMAIGFSRNGFSKEALLLYTDMLSQFIQPSNFSFSMALKACADTSDLLVGRAIHAQIFKHSEEADQVVNNALLRLYGKFFETMEAFRVMQREGMGFSWVTLTTILPICARVTALHSGKEIHAQIVKSAKKSDLPLLNSLMDMYAKCGAINYCCIVFNKMQSKDLTSWNTMLAGYANNGHMKEALTLYDKMVKSGIKPDGITFIALLSGCSHSGLTEEGKRLFKTMKKEYGLFPSLEHYACLVDILGRAGKIKEALLVAENMPMEPGGSIWGFIT